MLKYAVVEVFHLIQTLEKIMTDSVYDKWSDAVVINI